MDGEKYLRKIADANWLYGIVLIGGLITLFIFAEARIVNQERLQKRFTADALLIAHEIDSNLNENLVELMSLYSLYESDNNVSAEEFSSFTSHALARRKGIQALEWIPQVRDAERGDYERRYRTITERNAAGKIVEAAQRAVYYPVNLVEPLKGNEVALGFDLGSDAVRRTALTKAAENTGKPVATAKIRLVQETASQNGFLVFVPVYEKTIDRASGLPANDAALKGFALGVFRAGNLVEEAIAANRPEHLAVTLRDITAAEKAETLYEEAIEADGNIQRMPLSLLESIPASRYDFAYCGRQWRVEVTPDAQYIAANLSLTHWLVLPIGFLLTGLLGGMNHYLRREALRRREMEGALRQTNLDLATALAQVEKAQVQLVHQEKMAAIGQLAAGIAHEINNPLGFVVSNINMLEKYFSVLVEVLSGYRALQEEASVTDAEAILTRIDEILKRGEEKKTDLEFIIEDFSFIFPETIQGLERIGKIVKGMRNFSRGSEEQSFERYSLTDGLESTLAVANNELKYNARIEKCFAELPEIDAIGGEINQVLLNLLINAAQSIQAKGGEEDGVIRIQTWRDDDHVYCSIADNGMGIPAEKLSYIFNPFFTTKAVGKGTGLGLSISYDIIVAHHQGEINVESEGVGRGATFVVRLPIAHVPDATTTETEYEMR